MTEFSPSTNDALTNLIGLEQPLSAAYATLERSMQQQAVMLATNEIFWLSGVMFVGLAILVWFARPGRTGAKDAGAGAH